MSQLDLYLRDCRLQERKILCLFRYICMFDWNFQNFLSWKNNGKCDIKNITEKMTNIHPWKKPSLYFVYWKFFCVNTIKLSAPNYWQNMDTFHALIRVLLLQAGRWWFSDLNLWDICSQAKRKREKLANNPANCDPLNDTPYSFYPSLPMAATRCAIS